MIYYSMIFRVTKIYFNKISLIVTCKLIKYILYSNNKILRKIRYRIIRYSRKKSSRN